MERKEFNYYAFISYSRADEKWAKWIQRRLETYRFPTALRKENRNLPGKIFPICRDKTDLPGGVLWEQLKSQLDESEYLIVICSPSSAKSEWVSREISYFQELGRNRNIIPFIVDGEPHAADDTVECYNPALLNHPDEELLGVSVRELGRNKAVLRVIASLMQLRYDQLVMRDKRRTNRRR
ncbi:MAG: toll/interleukin-1 receptor domain-containing protein, partial [Acetatifactor sp.]|nr:toll/interleukin-1 receptor domain-containing protein [Acetatifactor sp.]